MLLRTSCRESGVDSLSLTAAVGAALLSSGAVARTQAFPPDVDLSDLLFRFGGDGSEGFVATGPEIFAFSSLVRAAGDVNGDAVDDLIIGSSYLADDFSPNRAYVVYGSAGPRGPQIALETLELQNGGDGTKGIVIRGAAEGDQTGRSVNGVGDVNGDGMDDLIIGAPGADPGGRDGAGRAYVVFGRSDGFLAEIDLAALADGDGSEGAVFNGILPASQTGYSVDIIDDINDDGLDDIIIGAPGGDPGGRTDAGVSFVVFGRASGFPAQFELSDLLAINGGDGSEGFLLTGISAGDRSGQAVSRSGDVNGDGLGDVLVGAPDALAYNGQVYLFYGRSTSFASEIALADLLPVNGGDGSQGAVLDGLGAGQAGISLGAADLNGDGLDDVLVGAPRVSLGDVLDGAGFLVLGRAQGLPAQLSLADLLPENGGDGSTGTAFIGDSPFFFAGISVAGAGDVNGDSLDDLMIGYDSYYQFERIAGAYVIYGNADTPFPAQFVLRSLSGFGGGDGSQGFVAEGGVDAFQVGAAGDVNGDGIADVAFGAPLADTLGVDNTGESYILYGREAPPEVELSTTLVGADLLLAVCRNVATGESTVINSPGVSGMSAVDCVEAGWTGSSGDFAVLSLRARSLSGTLQGVAEGLTDDVLICRNESTGALVAQPLADTGVWSCVDAGLTFIPGDIVTVILRGNLR